MGEIEFARKARASIQHEVLVLSFARLTLISELSACCQASLVQSLVSCRKEREDRMNVTLTGRKLSFHITVNFPLGVG